MDTLEHEILTLLAARHPTSSLCPSEVARRLDPDRWRARMSAVREAADRLAARGLVVITQRTFRVQATAARGPIRLRRGPAWPRS